MAWEFDHLVVAAERLEDGVAFVEDALGISLSSGGRHPKMGTWNRVASMGTNEYLEVIAIDPDAPPPAGPHWFGLDDFSGPPRLVTWVCRCRDLAAALAGSKAAIGAPSFQTRGEFSWTFAVPEDGNMPFSGAHPALIEWGGPHPAPLLEDQGFRMSRLSITHPQPSLSEALDLSDNRIEVHTGTKTAIRAEIETPNGTRWLG